MAKFTLSINRALVMRNALSDRANDLKELLKETVVEKRRYLGGDSNEVQTPKYSAKSVDTILTNIKLAIHNIDAATKEANAKTLIEVEDVDFKALMQPIEDAK